MATVIDAHSRRVIGWAIADRPVNSFIHPAGLPINTSTIRVLQRPVEFAQYASAQITAFAKQHRITRSMGYTGVCWDNAMAESFFATLKTEFYHRRVWPSKNKASREVGAWIEDRYNRRRRHASLGQVSPVEFELQYSNQNAVFAQAA